DHAGCQLLVGHLKTAIPVYRPDGAVGFGYLCAHGCWNSKSHGAQTGGVHPLVWSLVTDKLCAPHLVLPNACHVDRFWPGNFGQGFDDFLWRHQSVFGWSVAKWVRLTGVVDDLPPLGQIRGAIFRETLLQLFAQFRKDGFYVADDWNICGAVLGDFSRINIGVNHFCPWSK